MRIVFALLSGTLFGIGLTISDMTNPTKVQNFLDLAGIWDPSLVFVMVGAVLVALIGFRIVQRRPKPILATRFYLPTSQKIDKRLIGGSALFGLGWGLVGFCPGPAIAGLAWGNPDVFLFVVAMATGSLLAGTLLQKRSSVDEK